jgi:hypothetical protein
MPCRLCHSKNQRLFPTEIAVHAPSDGDVENLRQTLVFPQVLVCLDCGFSEFSISDEKLRELPRSKPTIPTEGSR